MSDRSGQGSWWLLALLAFGIVLMHHAPFVHNHSAAPNTTSAAVRSAHGAHSAELLIPAAGSGDRAAIGDIGADEEHRGMSHSLMHLCLVILAAAVAVVATLVMWSRATPACASVRPAHLVALGRAPPLPVARKLAVLGVLRL